MYFILCRHSHMRSSDQTDGWNSGPDSDVTCDESGWSYSDQTDDWNPGPDDSDLTFDDSDWFPNSDLENNTSVKTGVSVH